MLFSDKRCLAVEKRLRNQKKLKQEYSRAHRHGDPEYIAVAQLTSNVRSSRTSDKAAAGEKDGVDRHGSSALMHEKHLANRVRRNRIRRPETDSLNDPSSQKTIESARETTPHTRKS